MPAEKRENYSFRLLWDGKDRLKSANELAVLERLSIESFILLTCGQVLGIAITDDKSCSRINKIIVKLSDRYRGSYNLEGNTLRWELVEMFVVRRKTLVFNTNDRIAKSVFAIVLFYSEITIHLFFE